ncbi:acetyl-CoA C-acetyltransferase [Brevibacterium moorei]|uniref:acetyl-CoA C-acetyltransferase n=1 Tax=Brevibacterium moorei TaxID=2968457 RepID=UPI00211D13EA|nr:acetyl-CoA C-acetyltransferase [Brevibacterium sp. 68QC2CO]MCQ9385235.1 acetyl-CoA C-acetyltransferase [Brevibacterium sp. 68QC2CO]
MTKASTPAHDQDIVVCQPLRTGVGAFGGQFRGIAPQTLGATVVRAVIERSGLSPDAIDDVVFGQAYASSEAPNLGRIIALDAGLPITVPGMQLERRCGSGLQSIITAAGAIATGGADLIIAGGAESMSSAPIYDVTSRWGFKAGDLTLHDSLARGRQTAGGQFYPVAGGMIETAENLREDYNIGREEQDAFAVESHRRAAAATQEGKFADEIVPVTIPATRKTPEAQITRDEHIRADSTLEKLAKLKPMRAGVDPAATVTAGNASGQNDGAAATIVTTRAHAQKLGLVPVLKLVSWAVAGVEPRIMGIGPVPASDKALTRAGLSLADMDLIELNEAFAAQALAVTRAWDLGKDDFARLNVNGSGISLGHPVGATGARILATLAHEMRRRESRFGLETMCIGGGQGLAAVWERVAL